MWIWAGLAVVAILGLAQLARCLVRNPRGSFDAGLVWYGLRLYSRLMHSLEVVGRTRVPREMHPGALIVVCNHTAGVDPLIVQSVCPFEIRWMMAEDMRAPKLAWFWSWSRIIMVDRRAGDSRAAREALRHLESGGVLGLFPEGGLERPPEQILPFQAGVGMLIRRTGAPVLPMVISGTPQVDPAWASLWRSSHTRLDIHPIISYAGREMSSQEIADDLRHRYLAWTGWAANDSPPPIPDDASELIAAGNKPARAPKSKTA